MKIPGPTEVTSHDQGRRRVDTGRHLEAFGAPRGLGRGRRDAGGNVRVVGDGEFPKGR